MADNTSAADSQQSQPQAPASQPAQPETSPPQQPAASDRPPTNAAETAAESFGVGFAYKGVLGPDENDPKILER